MVEAAQVAAALAGVRAHLGDQPVLIEAEHGRLSVARMRRLLGLGAVAALVALAPAACASTLVTIEVPSAFVDASKVTFNGADHRRKLLANVLLPDGYDPGREYPVLFLLHGAGDSYKSWVRPDRGDVVKTAKGLDAIVFMPEGAIGFYTKWWGGGRRGDPGWGRYYLTELIPLIEKRYRIRPGRRWHAIAGLSMGGFGARSWRRSCLATSARRRRSRALSSTSGPRSHKRLLSLCMKKIYGTAECLFAVCGVQVELVLMWQPRRMVGRIK